MRKNSTSFERIPVPAVVATAAVASTNKAFIHDETPVYDSPATTPLPLEDNSAPPPGAPLKPKAPTPKPAVVAAAAAAAGTTFSGKKSPAPPPMKKHNGPMDDP